jgi:hypothetical protein
MSLTSGPEAQNALFELDNSQKKFKPENVPSNLQRVTLRLQFTPTYVIVGVYRLFTDESLYVPAWKKCKHATIRGAVVSMVWVRPCSHGSMKVADSAFGLNQGFLNIQTSEEIYRDLPREVIFPPSLNLLHLIMPSDLVLLV